MPKRGKGNISAEGQELLEDKEIWGNETALRGAIHDSRKRKRSKEDGSERPNYIHFHDRLVPPGGTGTRTTRRMDEKDRGQITGPKENATGELPYVPDKRVDT